jgi:hypothetical protein
MGGLRLVCRLPAKLSLARDGTLDTRELGTLLLDLITHLAHAIHERIHAEPPRLEGGALTSTRVNARVHALEILLEPLDLLRYKLVGPTLSLK